jgi:hypothetical protein
VSRFKRLVVVSRFLKTTIQNSFAVNTKSGWSPRQRRLDCQTVGGLVRRGSRKGSREAGHTSYEWCLTAFEAASLAYAGVSPARVGIAVMQCDFP